MELDALIERCRQGDELAWEAFVRQFQRRIYSLATCYASDPDEARDMAQDVFVKLYQTRRQWAGADVFVAWMVRVARNLCVDRIRARKARPPADDVHADEMVDLVAAGGTPEEQYHAASRRQLFYRALRRLSDISREVILLKDIQGLQIEEIAAALHIPVGTVKSRSNRARLELARSVLALSGKSGSPKVRMSEGPTLGLDEGPSS